MKYEHLIQPPVKPIELTTMQRKMVQIALKRFWVHRSTTDTEKDIITAVLDKITKLNEEESSKNN
jgi:hypothetical protein